MKNLYLEGITVDKALTDIVREFEGENNKGKNGSRLWTGLNKPRKSGRRQQNVAMDS